MSLTREEVASRWNTHTRSEGGKNVRPRWWKSKPVWQHINTHYEGIVSSDKLAFHDFIGAKVGGKKLNRGLSIACEEAHKELSLIEKGIVQNFDLYDFSTERLVRAKQHVERKGLEQHVQILSEDALAQPPEPKYDIIY